MLILRARCNTDRAIGVSGPMKPSLIGVVVAVNAVLLVATKLAFDAWVRDQFGYLDVDTVGPSGLLWVPLVIVATALVVIGFRLALARWAAVVGIAALAFIVVDHGIGALRDGEVSLSGAVTGGLMVVQLATLGATAVAAMGMTASPRGG